MFVSLIVFYFIFTFDFYFAIIILWSIKTLKARTERSDFKLRRSGTKISHIFLVCNVLIDNTDNLRAYILYDQVKKKSDRDIHFKKVFFDVSYGLWRWQTLQKKCTYFFCNARYLFITKEHFIA